MAPESGLVVSVAEGPRPPAFDLQWLELDRDGAVLLFVSGGHANCHAIVRFEALPYVPLAPVRISSRRGSGALVAPPFAAEIAPATLRPLFAETPLGVFAAGSDGSWEKPGTSS